MPEPTSPEMQAHIKETFAKQAAALPQYSLQDRIMEVIRDYAFQRKPTLHAALSGDDCHDKMAICVADMIINSAHDIEVKFDRFTEPKDGWGTYDDREYSADEKDAA